MFDRIVSERIHERREVHQHLAPTADHLRLLREYQLQAQAEAEGIWSDGRLVGTAIGEVHVRRYPDPMRDATCYEVRFVVNGKPHMVQFQIEHDVRMGAPSGPGGRETDEHAVVMRRLHTELASYLADMLTHWVPVPGV